ncbi:MAG TPA: ComF family protein [Pseudoneobacillus sp.]|nr:ComF family protein [Pseudoneobacillus sp.]
MLGLFEQNRCLICYEVMDSSIGWRDLFLPEKETHLCQNCQAKLQPIKGETCEICGRPFNLLDPQFRSGNQCNDCIRWEIDPTYKGVLTQNHSLYIYNDFLKEVIAKYKYRGDYILAKLFAEDIKNKIKELKPDAIVPIPLSEQRLLERGFNQSEALITEAGYKQTHLLTRIHSEKQSKKSRTERIHLPQVFQTTQSISGKILIIDDIYTTGSTLRHAAQALKLAGTISIHSLTIARG